MESCASLLFLVLLVALFECRVLASSLNWDHFVFAQQWPMTSCIDANLTHEHDCHIPKNVTTWTVHGLWPTENTSEGPQFCNTSSHGQDFNPDMLNPILPQLVQFWPNLYKETELYAFWKHEWCKHGTCAVALDAINSELKYFQKGIELGKTFDILSILKKGGIVPRDDQTYEYTEFLNALKQGLGAEPTLSCVYDKERKTQYIAEIHYCININFEIINCPKKNTPSKGKSHRVHPKTLEAKTRKQFGLAGMSQKNTLEKPELEKLQLGKTISGTPETCKQLPALRKPRSNRETNCWETETLAYPVLKYF